MKKLKEKSKLNSSILSQKTNQNKKKKMKYKAEKRVQGSSFH